MRSRSLVAINTLSDGIPHYPRIVRDPHFSAGVAIGQGTALTRGHDGTALYAYVGKCLWNAPIFLGRCWCPIFFLTNVTARLL